MPDLRVELGLLWRQVNREMHERMKEVFRDFDFSPMTHTLLHQIHKEPGVTVNQLARLSRTVKSNVSKLVDQLVAKDLVEKRADPSDQRLVRLYLTPKAEAQRDEVESRMQSAWLAVLNNIADDELEVAVGGLRAMRSALQRARPTPEPTTDRNGDEPR